MSAPFLFVCSLLWGSLARLASSLFTHRRDPTLWLIAIVLLELGVVVLLWRLIQGLE